MATALTAVQGRTGLGLQSQGHRRPSLREKSRSLAARTGHRNYHHPARLTEETRRARYPVQVVRQLPFRRAWKTGTQDPIVVRKRAPLTSGAADHTGWLWAGIELGKADVESSRRRRLKIVALPC